MKIAPGSLARNLQYLGFFCVRGRIIVGDLEKILSFDERCFKISFPFSASLPYL